MKLYKLTDKNDKTYGGCQWGPGVTHETSGTGSLCSEGWTHWYTDPLLAVLLNPVHGNFDMETAHLWEGSGVVKIKDHGLKVGCKKATTTRRIPVPTVTTEQKVAFGILCALEVYKEEAFVAWARSWLCREDRSERAARAAEAAARAAGAAVWAAWAAVWAARAAVWAARAARAATWAAARATRATTWAATWAAKAAAEAAEAAAWAAAEAAAWAARAARAAEAAAEAARAARAAKPLRLKAIAKKALSY